MRILVVGATGTIGQAVVEKLSKNNEVVGISRRSDPPVDLSDSNSIQAMYEALPELDAVVSAAGDARFGSLDQLSDEDFAFGLGNKLMGQVNLVRFGREKVREGGSFTLTSGILAIQPGPNTAGVSMVNAGLEGFVRAAAMDLPKGQRINVVSPPLVRETAVKMGWGTAGMPANEVAQAYAEAVFGAETGQVLLLGG